MRQAVYQPLSKNHVISFTFVIALLALFQPIPTVSAQQLIGATTQETDGARTQGRRIRNSDLSHLSSLKSLERKDKQASTYKPHRLIKKAQNAPIASVEPSTASSTLQESSSTPLQSLQVDNMTSQPKESSSLNRSVGAAAPLSTISTVPLSATALQFNAASTASTGTTPLSAAAGVNSSKSGSAGGRSLSRLASEMPGLTQLISPTPTSTPVVSINPAIGASPTSLSFTAQQGGSNPGAQTLSIINTGGGTLTWTASNSATWLTLSPASGSGTGTVTLSAATGTLTTGSYTSAVTLSGGTGVTPVTVPVTFTITAAPNITLNPSSLTYAATEGAANPANQTVSLTTTGGTLSWTASDNVSWLAVSPASGSNSNTLTASVNTTGLATGTHTGTITVSAAGVSSKTVVVTLTVNAPATSSADLTWNANTESDLAGYKVYRATASGAYGAPVATLTGNVTNYVATGLQVGTTYFFVVTAYDTAGNESSISNEVSKSIF